MGKCRVTLINKGIEYQIIASKIICSLTKKTNLEIDCFIVGIGTEADGHVSAKTTKILKEYGYVFTGMGCL